MIRRILILALVLLAFTMPTEAITYQELKTSPQFKLVHQHEYEKQNAIAHDGSGMYVYLNTYSVESLEYAAPHYKLKGTVYSVNERARDWAITEYELTATYDTNYSLASLIQAQQSVKPSPVMYAVIKAAQDDSGIQIELQAVKRYTWDGTVVNSPARLLHQSRPLDRSRSDQDLFAIVDAMFVVAYQQHFDDIVVK